MMALALTNKTDTQSNSNLINLCKNNQEENISEFTHTTATLTPTRLKSIEEQFFERSLVNPPAPFIHEHMAGFRIPSQVNIQSMIKSFCHFVKNPTLPFTDKTLPSNFAHLDPLSTAQPINFHTNIINNISTLNPSVDSLPVLSTLSANNNFGYCETDSSNSSTFSQMATGSRIHKSSTSNDISPPSKRTMQTRRNTRAGKASAEKTPEISPSNASTRRSTGGGRKPKNDHVSPEEDLKRQKRRERNKLAAARCRKKRVDQTNELENMTSELSAKHQELSQRMREIMSSYCAQESRFLEHLNGPCKNAAALHSNMPLLSAVDYEQIVNSMLVNYKDEHNNDDVSSSKDGDNQENCQAQLPLSSVVLPNPVINHTEIKVELSATSTTTTMLMPSTSPKPCSVPVISTVTGESITACTSSSTDPSQISAQSKRPNSLVLNTKPISSERDSAIIGAAVPTVLQTPSTGFYDSLEGSGLTPLQIPSTFAFLRSIATPLTDSPEGKTFTSM